LEGAPIADKHAPPPYSVTNKIVALVSEISERIGIIMPGGAITANPRLRRENQIRSIHSSLAIENNTLSLEQVTAVINGKRILGAPQEIREVKNAYEAYTLLLALDPFKRDDILRAHRVLMADLTKEAGRFRSGSVGIFAEKKLVHIAPQAKMVPKLMESLLEWAKSSEAHPLIKSCVFHYEFEFIHPFADGNGRMGRMWQTLILSRWKPLFAWLPIETLICERQQEYYSALSVADKAADSTAFVEFMLSLIRDVLKELPQTVQATAQAAAQVNAQVAAQVGRLLAVLKDESLSASELMERLNLRHRQSFSKLYLKPALELGLIEMTIPDKPNSSKQSYRAVMPGA